VPYSYKASNSGIADIVIIIVAVRFRHNTIAPPSTALSLSSRLLANRLLEPGRVRCSIGVASTGMILVRSIYFTNGGLGFAEESAVE